MRESRPYGSVRGACDETHVPTATTARVRHTTRRRGCGMAARGARAAGRAGAARRRACIVCVGRSGRADPRPGVRAGARAIGLDRRPRWGAGDPERIYRYAAELVALAPDVILAVSSAGTAPPVSMLVKSAFGLSLKRA